MAEWEAPAAPLPFSALLSVPLQIEVSGCLIDLSGVLILLLLAIIFATLNFGLHRTGPLLLVILMAVFAIRWAWSRRRRGEADGMVLHGVVTGLNSQTIPREGRKRVGATDTLWTFRVDGLSPDPRSPSASLVPVELQGPTIVGVMNDGDEIAVFGAASPGGLCRADYVRNLTTGAVVQPGGVQGRRHRQERPTTGGIRLPTVHGVVAGIAQRSEALGTHPYAKGPPNGKFTAVAVWTFRVHAASPSGGPVVVPVEMRGYGHIRGVLRDGDKVTIAGPWQRGLTLRPLVVDNSSTHERIATVNES